MFSEYISVPFVSRESFFSIKSGFVKTGREVFTKDLAESFEVCKYINGKYVLPDVFVARTDLITFSSQKAELISLDSH